MRKYHAQRELLQGYAALANVSCKDAAMPRERTGRWPQQTPRIFLKFTRRRAAAHRRSNLRVKPTNLTVNSGSADRIGD
jgi:hypothetical protein